VCIVQIAYRIKTLVAHLSKQALNRLCFAKL